MSELPRRKRERRKNRNARATATTADNDEKTDNNSNNSSRYNKNNNNNKGGYRKIEKEYMSIPSKMIGFLIGHRGCSIKGLRERTNCIINVLENTNNEDSDSNNNDNSNDNNDTTTTNDKQNKNNKNNNNKGKTFDSESKIELIGTCEEIAACNKEISFLVENGRFMLDSERGLISSSNEKEIAVDMKIPAKVCGMLIGGKGEKVQEIMLVTGCEIFVERDSTTHIEAGVATVHLKGNKLSVESAKREIRHVLSLFGTAGGKDASRIVFELPSYVSRDIIGEQGKIIKELQTKYHCSIRIKNFKSNDYKFNPRMNKDIQNTCVITITGEPNNCNDCKCAIDDIVGIFEKCNSCNKFVTINNGHSDEYMYQWYCNDCWDEYTKQQSPDSSTNTNNTPEAVHNNTNNNNTNNNTNTTNTSSNSPNNNNNRNYSRRYNDNRGYSNNNNNSNNQGYNQRYNQQDQYHQRGQQQGQQQGQQRYQRQYDDRQYDDNRQYHGRRNQNRW